MASQNRRPPFDFISDDILMKVFSHLSTIEISLKVLPVCRRWRSIGQNDQLWTHIALSERTIKMPFLGRDYPTLLAVLRRASMLRFISCPKIKEKDGDEMVCVLARHCPDLKEVHLPYCVVNKKTLQLLVDKCSDLVTVEISVKTIDDANALVNLANLKILRVKAVSKTPSTPAVVYRACREMVDNCSQLTGLHIENVVVSERAVELLVTRIGGRLTELSLHLNQLVETSLLALVGHCRNLEHLYLNLEKVTKDNKFCSIRSLSKLKHLKIKVKKLASYEPLTRLFQNTKLMSIESLKFSLDEISKSGADKLLKAVAESCPNLVRLNLSHLQDVSDCGLITIFEACTQLKVIVLNDIGPFTTAYCLQEFIPDAHEQIEYIKLCNCCGILVDDIRRLGRAYPKIDILFHQRRPLQGEDFLDYSSCYVH